jgi:hypothetical protein
MQVLRKANHNQTMIAAIVSTHKYKVDQELLHKRGLRGYRPKQAQVKAMQITAQKNLRALESPSILEIMIEVC